MLQRSARSLGGAPGGPSKYSTHIAIFEQNYDIKKKFLVSPFGFNKPKMQRLGPGSGLYVILNPQ
jgi:hypothetical protein